MTSAKHSVGGARCVLPALNSHNCGLTGYLFFQLFEGFEGKIAKFPASPDKITPSGLQLLIRTNVCGSIPLNRGEHRAREGSLLFV